MENMNPQEMSDLVVTVISGMVDESIAATWNREDEHPLDSLRLALQDNSPTDPRLERINWEKAREMAPAPVTNEDGDVLFSIADLVGAASFYARLYNRSIPGDMMDGDRMMLGFLKTFAGGLTRLGFRLDYPPIFSFLRDFNNHGVNMAVMAGKLVPGEEAYAVPDALLVEDAPADAADGPWGLSLEEFTVLPFPSGEAVYQTIMTGVRNADACVN